MNPVLPCLVVLASVLRAQTFPDPLFEDMVSHIKKQKTESREAASKRGFASAPLAMSPLVSISEPLTMTVSYHSANVADPNAVYRAGEIYALENGIAETLAHEGLPVVKVMTRPDGSGTVSFRARPGSALDFGRITLDIFPGPSARGAVLVPKRDLLERIVGRRFQFRAVGFLVPLLIVFDQPTFTIEGEALVPASRIQPFVYNEKKARFNFWSAAETVVGGAGHPMQDIMKSVELEVGPFKWDGEELKTSLMGLTLSGTKASYEPIPEISVLGLKLKAKLKDKVLTRELAPAAPKAPDGGLLVAAEYSALGLKRGKDGFQPVGEEVRSVFFNGAGTAEGQRNVTTSPQHRSVIEAAFGRSGGGRDLSAGKSWFCQGAMASGAAAKGTPQDVWYDRVETADGDALFVRLSYVKVKVALTGSADDLPADGLASNLAHLLFYLCPSPAE